MSKKVAVTTLSAAVAQNGTFTVGYPDDHTAGDFVSFGHSMYSFGLMSNFTQDAAGMSVSFGASDITVTYKGAATIPSGTQVYVELNKAGQNDRNQARETLDSMKRMTMIPLVRIDLGAPDTADVDGIVESQDLTSAGVWSVGAFNGVYGDPYANAKAVLDVPRALVGAWTTSAVVTFTGTDEYGDVIVEKSASAATFTGKKAFKTVTSITTATSITGLTVGTSDILGLPVFIEKASQIVGELQDGISIGGFSANKVLVPFDFNETDLLAPTAQALVAPVAGYITGIRGIVQKTVTTGGAITVEANTVAVVGLSITVANSDAAGVTYSDTVLKIATGLVAAGDDITVTPAAAFATAGAVRGYIEIEPASGFDGTFVAGVQTAPTATTGDVRGTYDPAEAANGALSFSLLAHLPTPTYKGVDNYDG